MNALSPARSRIPTLIFCGLFLTYTLGHLLWYSTTPLGLHPVLDDREILALARSIATRGLPAEAFYRAPLYPALLALALKAGVSDLDLPLLARLFNALCHGLSTGLVFALATSIWERRAAGFLSAALFGFNPVVLHFCGDALDTTLAMTLMLAGLWAVEHFLRHDARKPAAWLAGASLCFALGTLARPQVLTFVFTLPALMLMDPGKPMQGLRNCLAAALPAVLVLAIMGAINYRLAGDFAVLPWQGAYNLWAANKPGAHGRYFEQSLALQTYDEAANTTRLESEILYRREHPDAGAVDYRDSSRYWRERALVHIREAPAEWLRLMTSKLFYLLNNVEQYNNKTYALHKLRSPWLRWNPLCWSLVFIAGVVGFVIGWRRRSLRWTLAFATTYAAGVLIYFVSDRFRVPLVPLLAIGAGGLWVLPQWLRAARVTRTAAVALLALGLGGVSLWPLPQAEAEKTYVQDYLAMSRAAAEIGQHDQAYRDAITALSLDPTRRAAIDLACITAFNAWLHHGAQVHDSTSAPTLQRTCTRAAGFSPAAKRVAGILAWRHGEAEQAVKAWQELIDNDEGERAGALAALVMTDRLREPDRVLLHTMTYATMPLPILLALASRQDPAALAALSQGFDGAEIDRQLQSLRMVFQAE